MSNRDDDNRPRKRVRKRRRRRRCQKHEEQSGRGVPPRGEEIVEVGEGEFCTITVPREGGPTVVQRFETEEEAYEQHRKNVEADAPLVGVDRELN